MKRTIDAWLRLFEEEFRRFLPTFYVSLMLDEKKMLLYPNGDDLLSLVEYVVEEAANTFQSVRINQHRPREKVKPWLDYGMTAMVEPWYHGRFYRGTHCLLCNHIVFVTCPFVY